MVSEWLPATQQYFPDRDPMPGRHGFVGREAPQEIQDLYVRMSVPDSMRQRGQRTPSNMRIAKSKWWTLCSVIIGIIAIMIIAGVLSLHYGVSKPGEFGDSYGVVNTFFSGLALGGVIWAILLQKEELRLQREELSETRLEMEAQKLAIRRDAFERSFFEFVKAIDEKYQTVEYSHHITAITKQEAGQLILNYRQQGKKAHHVDGKVIVTEKGASAFSYACRNLSNEWPSIFLDMSPYFSLLFKVLLFIERADFSNEFEEKKFYIEIIRDRITQDELCIICFLLSLPDWHLDMGHGNIKGKIFKQMVEKYSFFLNLIFPYYAKKNKTDLKRQIEFYDQSAFGKTESRQIYIDKILGELTEK